MTFRQTLTLFDEQVGQCEHDRVATIQEVTAHDVGAGDGQATPGYELQDPVHLGLGVSIQLEEMNLQPAH